MNSARVKKNTKLNQVQINEEHAQLAAINKARPVSQYDMEGIILEINEKFEALFGISQAEVIGKHVSIFVDEATRQSPQYKAESAALWEKLRRGEDCSGEGKRTRKGWTRDLG